MNTPQKPQKRRFIPLTLAIVAAGTAAVVLAQPPRPPIDVAQLQSRAAEAFTAADTNSDGLVTLEEFTAMERPQFDKRHMRMHAGKRWGESADGTDEQLARREAMQDELFDMLDNDGDDLLSRAEFSADNQRTARQTLGAQRMFARLDQNGDGVLTIEEFPPSRLAALDADGDGTITREELKRGRASQQFRNS